MNMLQILCVSYDDYFLNWFTVAFVAAYTDRKCRFEPLPPFSALAFDPELMRKSTRLPICAPQKISWSQRSLEWSFVSFVGEHFGLALIRGLCLCAEIGSASSCLLRR